MGQIHVDAVRTRRGNNSEVRKRGQNVTGVRVAPESTKVTVGRKHIVDVKGECS